MAAPAGTPPPSLRLIIMITRLGLHRPRLRSVSAPKQDLQFSNRPIGNRFHTDETK